MQQWEAEPDGQLVRAAVRRLAHVTGAATNGAVVVRVERRRGGSKLKEHRRDKIPLVLTARSRVGESLGGWV